MSTMLKEVYDALKEAGASEEKASAAAVAVAAYSLDRGNLATKEGIARLERATKEDITRLERATKEDIGQLKEAIARLELVPLPRNSYTMAKPFKWTYAGKPLMA